MRFWIAILYVIRKVYAIINFFSMRQNRKRRILERKNIKDVKFYISLDKLIFQHLIKKIDIFKYENENTIRLINHFFAFLFFLTINLKVTLFYKLYNFYNFSYAFIPFFGKYQFLFAIFIFFVSLVLLLLLVFLILYA